MRKIKYIFIDPDCPNNDGKSRRRALPNFGYHFIVTKEGLVLHPTNIDIPANLIQGPIYDRDKYNKCSISIYYCGSLLPHVWLVEQNANCSAILRQRAALLQLLVDLRKHFPDAKILVVTELDGKELYAKNIIVNDSMNVLRKELSEL